MALIRGSNQDLQEFSDTLDWVPVGGVNHFVGTSIHSDFLECNGSAISRTTYAALYSIIGTTWGIGDGINTFNLPDLRGRFLIGAGSIYAQGTVTTNTKTKRPASGYAVSTIAAHDHALYNEAGAGSHTHTLAGGDSSTDPLFTAMYFFIKGIKYGTANLGLARAPKKYNDKITSSVGNICAFAGSSTPDWLLCNGAAVSRSTYADLFAIIGTTWGSGDGINTFNLPDFRNYFISNGSSIIGTTQAALTKLPVNPFTLPHTSHSHNFEPNPTTVLDVLGQGSGVNYALLSPGYPTSSAVHSHSSTSGGDSETRPNNVYVKYIIRVK